MPPSLKNRDKYFLDALRDAVWGQREPSDPVPDAVRDRFASATLVDSGKIRAFSYLASAHPKAVPKWLALARSCGWSSELRSGVIAPGTPDPSAAAYFVDAMAKGFEDAFRSEDWAESSEETLVLLASMGTPVFQSSPKVLSLAELASRQKNDSVSAKILAPLLSAFPLDELGRPAAERLFESSVKRGRWLCADALARAGVRAPAGADLSKDLRGLLSLLFSSKPDTVEAGADRGRIAVALCSACGVEPGRLRTRSGSGLGSLAMESAASFGFPSIVNDLASAGVGFKDCDQSDLLRKIAPCSGRASTGSIWAAGLRAVPALDAGGACPPSRRALADFFLLVSRNRLASISSDPAELDALIGAALVWRGSMDESRRRIFDKDASILALSPRWRSALEETELLEIVRPAGPAQLKAL